MTNDDRDPLDVDMRCVIDGRELRYGTRGSGTPVLLVMGFMARGRAWRSQIEALADRYQVVWFDHRGVGDSPGPAAKSMSELARDAIALMDHLQWQRAHVIGISMGGMISQELAVTVPHRVISLSLIVTHFGGVHRIIPTRKGIPRFLKAQLARDPEQRLIALRSLLVPPAILEAAEREGKGDEIIEKLREDFSPKPPKETRLSHVRAILRHNTRARLATLDCPTLVIQAKDDLLVNPKHSESLAAAIPEAKLVSFSQAGHGLVRQSNINLNSVLASHLESSDLAQRDGERRAVEAEVS